MNFNKEEEILRTLYLTQAFSMCHMHRASREVEGMSYNGSQNSEASCSSTWVGKFCRRFLLSSRWNWTSWQILLSYKLNWKQFKQSVRSVHKSAPFLSYMAHLLFLSVPSVLKNWENYPPRSSHDLAVGPAAHLLDMVIISWFSAKLCFQAIWGLFRSSDLHLTMWEVKEKPPLCDIQKFSV